MRKKYSGMMAIDMSDINGLILRLQNAREETMAELMRVSRTWGANVEGEYGSKISYAHGFKSHPRHANKGTFFDVEFSRDDKNNIRIAVGHASFIAKFLEVGTQSHVVNPRGTSYEISGIEGSKVLADTFKAQRDELGKMIEITINRLLSGK